MDALERRLFSEERNYYVATSEGLFAAPVLSERIETDILIVGGGLAGLATAIGLIERGVKDVTLIESEVVGFGASGRNGGFVFGGFSLGERALLKSLGEREGRWAYELTTAAVDLIRQRIEKYNIRCDHNESGVVLADWFREPVRLRQQQQWMQEKLGVDWKWLDREALQQQVVSERYYQGLWEHKAMHMHPLKYVKGIAKAFVERGGRCYEKTTALKIEPHKSGVNIVTNGGEIRAKRCVISTGGYMNDSFPKITRAILPISTYIAVTKPLGDTLSQLIPQQAAIYDTRFAFDYYRPLPDTRLLWGGRISIKARDSEAVEVLLRRDLERVFPSLSMAEFEYAWGGLMGYTIHKMPLIGQSHPNLWHVTGFGGHGVAPTTAGGELIAQALSGESDQLERFRRFKPTFAGGPLGLLGAQASYWVYQAADWLRSLSR